MWTNRYPLDSFHIYIFLTHPSWRVFSRHPQYLNKLNWNKKRRKWKPLKESRGFKYDCERSFRDTLHLILGTPFSYHSHLMLLWRALKAAATAKNSLGFCGPAFVSNHPPTEWLLACLISQNFWSLTPAWHAQTIYLVQEQPEAVPGRPGGRQAGRLPCLPARLANHLNLAAFVPNLLWWLAGSCSPSPPPLSRTAVGERARTRTDRPIERLEKAPKWRPAFTKRCCLNKKLEKMTAKHQSPWQLWRIGVQEKNKKEKLLFHVSTFLAAARHCRHIKNPGPTLFKHCWRCKFL